MTSQNPGVFDDYELEKKPIGYGGFATVFRAIHTPSGETVAVKRLNNDMGEPDAEDRMKYEIRVLRELAGHPAVMPILDADVEHRWYVMPEATRPLSKLPTPIDERQMADIILAVASGLAAAHAAGYTHRDVKPQNILQMPEDGQFPRRWVIADWGLVRNPKGLTTALRTPTNKLTGTDGFIAPEVLRGSHRNTSARSDVYSVGRVLLWSQTGVYPLAGEQKAPRGAFRRVVRKTTVDEPQARLSLNEFVAEVEKIDFDPPVLPMEATLGKANAGDPEAVEQLFDFADENRQDSDFFLDFLAELNQQATRAAVIADPDRAVRLVEEMSEHVRHNWGYRSFGKLKTPMNWMLSIAKDAGARGDLDMLEDVAAPYLLADARTVQYDQRRTTQGWLDGLRGGQAQTVSRALRSVPDAVDWLTQEGWQPSRGADRYIRAAVVRE